MTTGNDAKVVPNSSSLLMKDLFLLPVCFNERQEGIQELIIATNPSVEGDTTTLYIARMFRDSGVRVTRPARGIPLGSSLEFVDRGTISTALDGREDVD